MNGVLPVRAERYGDVQIGFLQQLMREGSGNSTDVVFLDMDILVVDSLAEVRLCPSVF